jgi:hypothetical protein
LVAIVPEIIGMSGIVVVATVVSTAEGAEEGGVVSGVTFVPLPQAVSERIDTVIAAKITTD